MTFAFLRREPAAPPLPGAPPGRAAATAAAIRGRAVELREALRRPHEERTLGQRIMISGMMSTMEFGLEGVLRLISTVILTRILTPEDFGVFAVVLFVLYLLNMVSDLGIRSIVLTREGELEPDFLRCCWSVQLIRGALVSVFVVAAGLLLAGLQWAGLTPEGSSYDAPEVPWVVCAAALVPLLGGLESPKPFLYEREMRFLRVSSWNMAAGLVGTVLTILLVLLLQSVWALLAGTVASLLLRVAGSFLVFRGPAMRWRLEGEAARLILDRGKWIMSHSGLMAATQSADRILLGLLLSADQFGFYYLAQQIVALFRKLIGKIHSAFDLQLFRSAMERFDAQGVSDTYYRYRLVIDALSSGLAGGLFAVAPVVIGIIYDDRYAAVALFLQILALELPLTGVGFIRSAFAAQRRFKWMTLLSIIQTATIWLGLAVALLVMDSVVAAVLVVALHRLPELAVLLAKGRREGWVNLGREARIFPLFLIGAVLGWAASAAWIAVMG